MLLSRDPTVDGMKTGYTEAAGYCLVASAQRDLPNGKRRLLSVVLNTTSMERAPPRARSCSTGAMWPGMRCACSSRAEAIATPGVEGKTTKAKLGAEAGVFVSVPKGEGSKLVTKIERTDPLVAPLAKGARKVGVLKVATAPARAGGRGAAGGAGAGRRGRHLRPRLGRHPPVDQVIRRRSRGGRAAGLGNTMMSPV